VQEKNLFITSKDPGIIPRVVNVLTPLVYSWIKWVGSKQISVNSAEDAYHVMLYGQHNLTVATTELNSSCSRSHCIFNHKHCETFRLWTP
jgi:hypothetical protein